MKIYKFIVPARNKQEKIGTYLIVLAQFFMIADSFLGGSKGEPVGTNLSSLYFIAGIFLTIIGCVVIYASKKRNGTLSDLNVFFRYLPWVLLLGLLIFGGVYISTALLWVNREGQTYSMSMLSFSLLVIIFVVFVLSIRWKHPTNITVSVAIESLNKLPVKYKK